VNYANYVSQRNLWRHPLKRPIVNKPKKLPLVVMLALLKKLYLLQFLLETKVMGRRLWELATTPYLTFSLSKSCIPATRRVVRVVTRFIGFLAGL